MEVESHQSPGYPLHAFSGAYVQTTDLWYATCRCIYVEQSGEYVDGAFSKSHAEMTTSMLPQTVSCVQSESRRWEIAHSLSINVPSEALHPSDRLRYLQKLASFKATFDTS